MPTQKYRVQKPGGFWKKNPKLKRWALLALTFGVSFGAGIGLGAWTLV